MKINFVNFFKIKIKSILILFILMPLMTLNSQEKEKATLAPLGAMGDLNDLEKRIIFNSLEEALSKYFHLTTQKMYEKAENKAFEELEYDECTEDQCIALIQEFLQVENFFKFEIVKVGNFQQLKITKIDLDNNRDVRTTTCDNCNISQTNQRIDELVKKLFKEYEIKNQTITSSTSQNNSQISNSVGAIAMWEVIKESNNKNDFKEFINTFPNAPLSQAAVKKIELIEALEKQKISELKKLTFYDSKNNVFWQKNKITSMPFFKAEEYCSNLKINEIGGWELPTTNELTSLLPHKNKISEQLNSYYWSRDAYRFDLQDGSHRKKSYDKEYYVRCINHI